MLPKLKQGYSKNLGKAPHKPILLLAVIDMFEKQEINANRIYISAALVSRFKSFWQALVTTGHTPNFALPFYHLNNEKPGFWNLKSAIGLENVITKTNSIKSFKALNEFVQYAYFSEAMYAQVLNAQSRAELKNYLLETYFGLGEVTLGQDALNLFENDILHESPDGYKSKLMKVYQAPKEVQEEERFMRSGAFKRAIPRIYQSTCAITGLGLEGVVNVSMVDACHIVPFATSQNDTIGNGIALCPNMHRAFDRGIISISSNFDVLVSDKFIERASGYNLRQFQGTPIWLPKKSEYHPNIENLAWHREYFGFEKS